MMFQLSENRLDPAVLKQHLENQQAGACVTFEGWVRNHNEGHAVMALEYESYPELALSEAEIILQEAQERFPILSAHCTHRTGKLEIGDLAVWVGVSSAHRKEAFEACRFIIDEIKHRLPIWKKEYYTDGHSGWVNCEACSGQNHHHRQETIQYTETEYYQKQIALPEVREAGQEKLKQSKVLVVGSGGLGSPALLALTQAGIGAIGICDFDFVSASNLHRQCLYQADQIGQLKVNAAKENLVALNPFVQIQTHTERLSSENASELFGQYDLVLGCTDNFETQFLLSDMAVMMQTPLIQASVYQYEGWIQAYIPTHNNREQEPCLRCLWSIPPQPGCTGTCDTAGTLGAVVNTLGSIQAMEALKYLLGLPGAITSEKMLLIDLLNLDIQAIQQSGNPDCPCCHGSRFHGLPKSIECSDQAIVISPDHRFDSAAYTWLDIREDHEKTVTLSSMLNVVSMPLSRFSFDMLKPNTSYLICCSHGVRSHYLAKQLNTNHGLACYSLEGGLTGQSFKNYLEVFLKEADRLDTTSLIMA